MNSKLLEQNNIIVCDSFGSFQSIWFLDLSKSKLSRSCLKRSTSNVIVYNILLNREALLQIFQQQYMSSDFNFVTRQLCRTKIKFYIELIQGFQLCILLFIFPIQFHLDGCKFCQHLQIPSTPSQLFEGVTKAYQSVDCIHTWAILELQGYDTP